MKKLAAEQQDAMDKNFINNFKTFNDESKVIKSFAGKLECNIPSTTRSKSEPSPTWKSQQDAHSTDSDRRLQGAKLVEKPQGLHHVDQYRQQASGVVGNHRGLRDVEKNQPNAHAIPGHRQQNSSAAFRYLGNDNNKIPSVEFDNRGGSDALPKNHDRDSASHQHRHGLPVVRQNSEESRTDFEDKRQKLLPTKQDFLFPADDWKSPSDVPENRHHSRPTSDNKILTSGSSYQSNHFAAYGNPKEFSGGDKHLPNGSAGRLSRQDSSDAVRHKSEPRSSSQSPTDFSYLEPGYDGECIQMIYR